MNHVVCPAAHQRLSQHTILIGAHLDPVLVKALQQPRAPHRASEHATTDVVRAVLAAVRAEPAPSSSAAPEPRWGEWRTNQPETASTSTPIEHRARFLGFESAALMLEVMVEKREPGGQRSAERRLSPECGYQRSSNLRDPDLRTNPLLTPNSSTQSPPARPRPRHSSRASASRRRRRSRLLRSSSAPTRLKTTQRNATHRATLDVTQTGCPIFPARRIPGTGSRRTRGRRGTPGHSVARGLE